MEAIVDTETPTQVERLHDDQSVAAIILRTGLKEMWAKWLWNWRVTVPETIKMPLFRPPVASCKLTVKAACTVSTCSPCPQPKNLPTDCQGKGVSLWTGVPPLPPQLLVCTIKQTFLSTNLTLLALERQAARPDLQLHVLRGHVTLLYIFQRGWGHQAVALVSTLKQAKRHKCWV